MRTSDFELGQDIVVSNYSRFNSCVPYEICKVTKITNTEITLSNSKRYSFKGKYGGCGDEVGGGDYGTRVAIEAKGLMRVEEAQKRIKEYWHKENRKKISRNIRDFNWLLCTDEELLEVNKIIVKYAEMEKNNGQKN